MTRLLQRYAGRILIGLALIVLLYAGIHGDGAFRADHREQAFAKKVEDLGAFVGFHEISPRWLPKAFTDHCPFYTRIGFITLNQESVPARVLFSLTPNP
jgi:hypothetical protein